MTQSENPWNEESPFIVITVEEIKGQEIKKKALNAPWDLTVDINTVFTKTFKELKGVIHYYDDRIKITYPDDYHSAYEKYLLKSADKNYCLQIDLITIEGSAKQICEIYTIIGIKNNIYSIYPFKDPYAFKNGTTTNRLVFLKHADIQAIAFNNIYPKVKFSINLSLQKN